MMKFSKKVEYALTALIYMSKKPGGELTTTRELSDKFEISLELMGKILQLLVKNRLVASVQGVKGGYYLARSKDQIKISTIIAAIDGPIALTDCIANNGLSHCDRERYCLIKSSMENIQKKIVNILDKITLNDFQKTYF